MPQDRQAALLQTHVWMRTGEEIAALNSTYENSSSSPRWQKSVSDSFFLFIFLPVPQATLEEMTDTSRVGQLR